MLLPPRRVVPTGHYPAEKREIASRMIQQIFCDLPVIVNRPVKIVEDWKFLAITPRHFAMMGRKLHGGVHAKRLGILKIECLEACQIDLSKPFSSANFPPMREGRIGIGKQSRTINSKQRTPIDPDIAPIPQSRKNIPDKPLVTLIRMLLTHEHFVLFAIPATRPVFVRPTKAKRKIRLPAGEKTIRRHFQQSAAIEPIVIEAKAVYPELSRHLRLFLHDARIAQIVVANVRMRNVRLIMTPELRPASANVRPLRKTFAPPRVVLRNAMKLRQIESNRLDIRFWRSSVSVWGLWADIGHEGEPVHCGCAEGNERAGLPLYRISGFASR